MSTEVPAIEISVNGASRTVPAGQTILGLLESLGIQPGRVAVELDRRIVKPPEWPTARLQPGAQVEIVHFVGGG